MSKLPEFLERMLYNQYGKEILEKIEKGYSKNRLTTLRINTLKAGKKEIKNNIEENGIKYKEVNWYEDALIIENAREEEIRSLEIYEKGKIYLQSLSSMIPPIVLNPKSEENILDMASAPGGKTTQMSALSGGEAFITACEKNKIRAERLKYNIEKQGTKRVTIMTEDARKLDDFFSFDKILLDAPCSGSGTINIKDEKMRNIFTGELIKKSTKVQEELLIKAIKLLKPGKEMVYSTCSILKQENEEIVKKVLNKENTKIIPIPEIEGIPTLPVTIEGTLCVMPTDLYEGFFVAKIKKC
jgi:tRNA (cytosine40_48-C5)-methyltransferase